MGQTLQLAAPSCGQVSGPECKRLRRRPVTLLTHINRAVKVNPVICLCVFLSVHLFMFLSVWCLYGHTEKSWTEWELRMGEDSHFLMLPQPQRQ